MNMAALDPEVQEWIELAQELQAKGMKPETLRQYINEGEELLVAAERLGLNNTFLAVRDALLTKPARPATRTPKTSIDNDRLLDIMEGLIVSATSKKPYIPTFSQQEEPAEKIVKQTAEEKSNE